jgi:hypothetical protein
VDAKNRFDSRRTHLLMRLEYALALIVCVGLALAHIEQIRWLPFIGLFAYIDLIGYLPGAIAYRRSKDGKISPTYHFLYNTMHSGLTNTLVAGAWAITVGPEWALLAIPIHLCGDRALFGNFFKPFSVPFEPHVLPAFSRFEQEIETASPRYRTGSGSFAVAPEVSEARPE